MEVAALGAGLVRVLAVERTLGSLQAVSGSDRDRPNALTCPRLGLPVMKTVWLEGNAMEAPW